MVAFWKLDTELRGLLPYKTVTVQNSVELQLKPTAAALLFARLEIASSVRLTATFSQ